MKVLRWIPAVLLAVLSLFTIPAAGQTPGPVFIPTTPPAGLAAGTRLSRPIEHPELAVPGLKPRTGAGESVQPQVSASTSAASNLAYLAGWSKLTLSMWVDSNWEIYRANGSGDGLTRLTTTTRDETQPRLNRANTEIVYLARVADKSMDIFRMSADGQQVTRLTNTPGCDEDYPSWSPDGTRILFASPCENGQWHVYTMNRDGTDWKKLADGAHDDVYPTWSPDGSRVAWAQFPYGSNSGSLMILNLNTSQTVAQRTTLSEPGYLTWSPDGNYIGMSLRDGDGYGAIAISVNPLFSDRRIGYGDLGDYLLPFGWTPDGHYLAYTFFARTYIEEDARWQILDISSKYEPVYPVDNSGDSLYFSRFSMNPSWSAQDDQPPVSWILPLPQYSSVNGFSLTWSGADPGGSGLQSADLQSRLAGGTWTDWLLHTHTRTLQIPTSGNLGQSLKAGDTLEFRERAVDNAMNLEAWRDGAQASTRLYTYQLSGKMVDNRGVPAPEGLVALNPAAWDTAVVGSGGTYAAWLLQTGPHSVQGAHPGYGSLPAVNLNFTRDLRYDFYLPPVDNLLPEGGFEGDLSSWQLQGDLTVTQDNQSSHSGSSSLRLGEDCSLPCLSSPETADPTYSTENVLRIDSLGGAHAFVLRKTSSSGEIHELYRPEAGDWTDTLVYSCTACYLSGLNGVITNAGGVEGFTLMWLDLADTLNDYQVYTSQRSAEGTWSTALQLPDRTVAAGQLLAGADGRVHYLYSSRTSSNATELRYQQRGLNGVWGSVRRFSSPTRVDAAALTPDGNLHLFWTGLSGFYRRVLSPVGNMGAQELVASTIYPRQIFPLVDPQGELSVVWTAYNWTTTNRYYSHLKPAGGWTTPEKIAASVSAITDAAISPSGWVHIISGRDYQYRASDGMWRRIVLPANIAHAQLDNQNRLHLLVHDGIKLNYLASLPVFAGGQGSASRTVAIPGGMLNTTLSFLYQLPVTDSAQESALKVSVEGAAGPPAIYQQAQAGWQQGWLDLSAWAGQTVTLHFTFDRAAGEGNARVNLDEVSLGQWITPQVIQVAPAQKRMPITAAWELTISGNNFRSVREVRIGTRAFTPAAIDEHTLRISLNPEDTPTYGPYDVVVVNGDGTIGSLPGGLTIAGPLFLPLVTGP